jgi:hypothetical protein
MPILPFQNRKASYSISKKAQKLHISNKQFPSWIVKNVQGSFIIHYHPLGGWVQCMYPEDQDHHHGQRLTINGNPYDKKIQSLTKI